MIKEAPDRNFCWPEAFHQKCVDKHFWGRRPLFGVLGTSFPKKNPKIGKKVLFSFKIRLSKYISGQITAEIWKIKISKTLFRQWALKCRCGGSRPKFFLCGSFFIESLSKKIFRVGDPKNRRFWGFFQKSMSEISANWEKTCFLCCRFFRKVEEMGGYFGGCALKFFPQNCTNIARFVCKN